MIPRFLIVGLFCTLLVSITPAQVSPQLTFEVTVGEGLLTVPTTGRVLLFLRPGSQRSIPEDLFTTSGTSHPDTVVLGADGDELTNGATVVLDERAPIFPLANIGQLRRGSYYVQAVFDHNRDLRLINAPGNLVSKVERIELDPQRGGKHQIRLSRSLPQEQLPGDTDDIKFLKFRSEKLSRFHGRPIYLRAGVILPPDYERHPKKRYPLRIQIGGFGTRYTAVQRMMHPLSSFRRAWTVPDAPRMILLHLDGAGPLGDPYQVNSANHGPYGDALLNELVPFVESKYRCIGQGWARVTEGHSTGGWVSLALQIFYPDSFQGCWSHAPDPVDFRAFELVNIYQDGNFYVNSHGFERPACRNLEGDTVFTVRHEVGFERVLGRGGKWSLSGKDWASWNATFGPRGKDGLPVPLWDGSTGKIDSAVLDHWKKYDLRVHLQTYWAQLAPRLSGKLRIWVGDADDYFLNNAVHHLDHFLRRAKPPSQARITFAARKDHSWRGVSELEILKQMGEAIERARPRP